MKKMMQKNLFQFDFGKIKLIIWDLDETLYYNEKTIGQVRDHYKNIYDKVNKNKFKPHFKILEQSYKWYEIIARERNIDAITSLIHSEKNLNKEFYIAKDLVLLKYFRQSRKKHVLISNSSRRSVNRIMKRLAMHEEKIFSEIYYAENMGSLKPNTALLSHILRTQNVLPKEALAIGDSLIDDIKPAQTLGIKTVHITHNHQQSQADFRASSIHELIGILAQLDHL